MAERVDIGGFIERLQAGGRYSFADAEAQAAIGVSRIAVAAALRRLRAAGRIAMPRRGFNVIVTPEYREAGSPPASWFVDDLMSWLGRPYYVALLSAAAVHGAAHQQPMRFQVITSLPMRSVAVGRGHIDFHVSRAVESSPIVRMQIETGYMRVSTPEATAFDLVRFVRVCGGLSNIATVLGELAEKMAPDVLRPLAFERAAPEVQRLGYLLDIVGQQRLADPLMRGLTGRRVRPVLLAPGSPAGRAHSEPPWRVIANERVEIDA